MARPWKHPVTGIYWLRRAVPADLRPLVGKREEKRTLQTRDPAEARKRHVEALAELDERWAGLRKGRTGEAAPIAAELVTLTEAQAHERAAWMYGFWLDKHRQRPSEQTFWPTHLYERLWREVPAWEEFVAGAGGRDAGPEAKRLDALRAWCLDHADDVIAVRGWTVDAASRLRLAKAVAAAVQRASLRLERLALGEVEETTTPTAAGQKPAGRASPVSFDELLEGWTAERKPGPKTVYEWSREVGKLTAFLGHAEASRVTPEDVIRWKEAMVAQGLSAKTINDAKLAAVRTLFQWGVDSRRLPVNPAERVRLDVKKSAKARRSFSDEEAATILKAALNEADPVLRWVPWLCAYSGARLSEVCQLRVEDVREVEGIWCMVIDAEAGSLKTASSERTVPLHRAVLDSGFLAFVRGVGSGPLFAGLPPDKFGKRGGNGTKVLGPWVRGLGLDEKRLAPSHSWRHRMKTLARRHGLAVDVTRALMGHSGRGVDDSYGEFEVATLHQELIKVPTLLLPPDGVLRTLREHSPDEHS